MTKERFTIEVQAAILCGGYHVGCYTTADIEHWAVQQIDASDAPSLAIMDLAILRDTNPIDVMSLLRSLGRALPPNLPVDIQIGLFGLLYDAKRISLEKAVQKVCELGYEEGVTQDQRKVMEWLGGMCYLAFEESIGTVSQVESGFLSFVRPYADFVRAHDTAMFGEGSL
jgi:hypothetical protein